MTVKTAFNHALLTIPFLHELIQGVVTVMTSIILKVEVVGFITLKTVCVVMAIKTVGDVTGKALFSDEEVIHSVIAVGTYTSIGIVVVGIITVQAMGEVLTI